ncbi:MAG: UvrD-helicase domain-containing protein, partial [Beijerinckiaceae bacterium]
MRSGRIPTIIWPVWRSGHGAARMRMMNERRKPPPDTIDRQRLASSPEDSAWVSANAGSGKTEVLVQRVMRLLLTGARPDSILCLTFTKAAAAEMMNRLFMRLGEWIMLGEGDLKIRIAELTGKAATPAILKRARRLFADALETPGGLKVQTIHAFCERLLQLFPFDANVPARFSVLDETQSNRLMAESIAEQIAAMEQDETTRPALALIASDTTLEGLDALMQEALKHKDVLLNFPTGDTQDALAQFGIAAPADPDSARLQFGHHPFWQGPVAKILEALKREKAKSAPEKIEMIRAAHGRAAVRRHEACREWFLGKDSKVKELNSVMYAGVRKAEPEACAVLDSLCALFLEVDKQLTAHAALARSAAMRQFMSGVLRRHAAKRAERGALDFDDLISKTRDLLNRPDIGPWILYKLDHGLAHILVDEAQDTSPAQWDIISKLAEEFTTGATAHEKTRTIFAVGDEKQSIYGFQGAAPRAFGEMRRALARRHSAVGRTLQPVSLDLSFRSTPEILSVVDKTFGHAGQGQGLSFDGNNRVGTHTALNHDRAGFVDLWPQMIGENAPEPDDAWAPDAEAGESIAPVTQLTNRIASQILYWLRHGDPNGRPVRPGDIMILVRQRGPLFEETIKAL